MCDRYKKNLMNILYDKIIYVVSDFDINSSSYCILLSRGKYNKRRTCLYNILVT